MLTIGDMKLTKEQESRLEHILVSGNVAGEKFGKDFWTERLQTMPQEQGEQVLAIFELLPKEIEWLGQIQLRKEEALARQNENAWQQIIAEEEQHLSSLINSINQNTA